MLIKKGTFVRVRKHVLLPGERLNTIPESTRKVPLKLWVKGKLLEEAELFEEAKILTASGRIISGVVKEEEPKYKHSYGNYVEEIHKVREIILNEFWGDSSDIKDK